jgi:GDP-mannose transporter
MNRKVLSSVIAAWSDVSGYVNGALTGGSAASKLGAAVGSVSTLNLGYIWMLINCVVSAAYVSPSPSVHV